MCSQTAQHRYCPRQCHIEPRPKGLLRTDVVNTSKDSMTASNGAQGVALDRTIIRGYDVRGYTRDVQKGGKTLRQNLTADVAEAFGRALGSMREVGETVVVTGDHRNLGKELVAGLVHGFRAVGVNVILNSPQKLYGDEPFLPTGATSWFLIKSALAGAVQVTGSHNPPEFNGLKISHGLEALYGEELAKIGAKIEQGNFRPSVPEDQRGKVTETNILAQYLSMLDRSFPPFQHQHRVVVDSGNGLGCVLAEALRKKGVEVKELNGAPHADFPNHPADPSTEEGTAELKQTVRELNASLGADGVPWIGIAIDGDADRSGFIDEAGEVVWPERMAAVFYKKYLEAPGNAGHMLALDVRASNVIEQAVLEAGGKGVFIPAGYPCHRAYARIDSPEHGKMKVAVSAEASGHFFYPTAAIDENGDPTQYGGEYLIDDGIYSAIKFLHILDSHDLGKRTRVTDMMASLPTFCTSNELRIYVPDESKAKVVEAFRKEIVERYGDRLKPTVPMQTVNGVKLQAPEAGTIEVDGIRLQQKDGSWLVVRISNTSPNLVLKFESDSRDKLSAMMEDVRELLAKHEQVELDGLDRELARWQS